MSSPPPLSKISDPFLFFLVPIQTGVLPLTSQEKKQKLKKKNEWLLSSCHFTTPCGYLFMCLFCWGEGLPKAYRLAHRFMGWVKCLFYSNLQEWWLIRLKKYISSKSCKSFPPEYQLLRCFFPVSAYLFSCCKPLWLKLEFTASPYSFFNNIH